jgi:hypothetical protein
MAAPTLATFTEREGDLAFIYWGGTSTSGTLLGQVLDFSYTTTKGKKEAYRLGDSSRYTNYNSVATDWKLTLAEDETFKDVGVIFGKTRPTSGWTGGETFSLATTDAAVTITICHYKKLAPASSTLAFTETLSTSYVEATTRPLTANESTQWEFSGTSAAVSGAMTAGV